PPYNTGKDFIYPDDYREPLEAYLRRTGQVDEEGRRLTTNTRASGRFHSKWLNMMYPRLLLARQLLREDGVIFVSIDDNEVHNLRHVMNEVFGEENFVGVFIWRKKEGGGQTDDFFVREHEYVLVYRKSSSFIWIDELVPVDSAKFNRIDETGRKFMAVKLAKWGAGAKRSDRPTMYFPIKAPDGRKVYPVAPDGSEGRWRVGKKRMQHLIENDLIEWELKDGEWIPYEKIYEGDKEEKAIKDRSILFDETSTAEGTNVLTELFGKKDVFENPKPPNLIKYFMRNNTCGSDVILDFFAGSCSSAHAVLQQNLEDGGNRRFVMVQLPEPLDSGKKEHKAAIDFCDQLGKPRNIAEIGKERIRRVIAKLQAEREGQMELNPDEDLGFKVFKLQRSHFKEWQPVEPTTPQALDDLFSQHASPLVENWQPQALLTEILLIEGFPLDSRVVPLEEGFPENAVWRVRHPDVGHELFVCLDEEIQPSTVEHLPSLLRAEDIFICLDSALSDEAKVTLDDRIRLKVI
ncbi:site-specific DNA-methyltransferase, partial [Candidatus Parcubacteria bacterium]